MTKLEAFEPPRSLIFPSDHSTFAMCWHVCNEIQIEKILAPGLGLELLFFFFSPRGKEAEIKGKTKIGRDRLINRWTRRKRDRDS